MFSWQHMPELTDRLLTCIEENEACRIALGFSKGSDVNAGKQSGQRLTDHCERLAEQVLIQHESNTWKDVKPKALVNAVRQRIVA